MQAFVVTVLEINKSTFICYYLSVSHFFDSLID